jgi:hypothetical protein
VTVTSNEENNENDTHAIINMTMTSNSSPTLTCTSLALSHFPLLVAQKHSNNVATECGGEGEDGLRTW